MRGCGGGVVGAEPTCLDDQPGDGDANELAELGDSNAAMVWESGRRSIPHPAADEGSQAVGPQEHGHQHACVKVRHAHKLHVQCQKHKRTPGHRSNDALQSAHLHAYQSIKSLHVLSNLRTFTRAFR